MRESLESLKAEYEYKMDVTWDIKEKVLLIHQIARF